MQLFYLFIFYIFYYIFSSITFPMLSQKSPIPSPHFPTNTFPFFWPWRSPVLGHIQFACPMGLSFQWWLTRPSFDTYAARDKSSGVLVSSYCCSTYRVAVPFSSLVTFSSSSIGGPVIHPLADCEHPLLCLLGVDTTISGDPSHNQLPNADTIAYTSKISLKGPRYSSLLWDYAGA